jgi:hypothetical protein
MVGEDLFKTNSRLRITRTPESLPSFLNDLVENVAAQTAAANIVDPAGSKNLFHYEVTPYDPGSDHDMFNDSTVGVPALMFGHWPDWTHHTSEDTVDKVDPTTLKRVGVLAAATALWLATADDPGGLALVELTAGRYGAQMSKLMLEETPETWDGRDPQLYMQAAWAEQAIRSTAVLLSEEGELKLEGLTEDFGRAAIGWGAILAGSRKPMQGKATVPRRLFIGPLGDSYASMWFRETLGEGYGWWRDWEGKVPHWEIFVYEVLNYTDGKRSLAEIEDAVEAEFGDIPDGVVEHILRDLEKVDLVEFAPPKAD